MRALVLGQAADPIDAMAREAEGPQIDQTPAVLFADQSKAFERLSLAWFAEVLRRCGMPPWLMRTMLALVMGRAVR